MLYLAMCCGLMSRPPDLGANFLSTNTATNWLNFVFGAVMLALGICASMRPRGQGAETT